MHVKVVDASAIGAMLFAEPESTKIAAELHDAVLVAPALLPFEVANICLKKMRRHEPQRAALLDMFQAFLKLPIEMVAVDHIDALYLSEASGLTFYDASYLWLAMQMNAALVTLDRQLLAAAAARRIKLMDAGP